MLGRTLVATFIVLVTMAAADGLSSTEARAAGRGQPTNWNRFYYYPYVYYPHNFQRSDQQYDHMYYRYPPHRRIPVYNKSWYNFYPSAKPYHRGHHFILDVF
ncbi:MAG: hypothetical protein ACE5KM_17420 [Planctomycetaceae bacterium]